MDAGRHQNHTYPTAPAPFVQDSVCMRIFRLFLGLCSVQDMENLLQVLYNGSKVLLLEIQFYLQYVYNVLIRIETTALLVDLESPKIVSYI